MSEPIVLALSMALILVTAELILTTKERRKWEEKHDLLLKTMRRERRETGRKLRQMEGELKRRRQRPRPKGWKDETFGKEAI